MSYQKGRAFEYRVKYMFQQKGYRVFRMAGSRPVDLIALKRDAQPILIECKSSGRPDVTRMEKLRELASKTGARLIVARKNKRRIILEGEAHG